MTFPTKIKPKQKRFFVLDEFHSKLKDEKHDSTNQQIELIKKSSSHWEIVLNRPEKYNAITQPMYQRIMQILDQAVQDQQLILISLTGKGKYYSSGTDLADFAKFAVRFYYFNFNLLFQKKKKELLEKRKGKFVFND